MKYLKLFENFEDIHRICREYGIENYTINSDGSIDVDDDVIISIKYELGNNYLIEELTKLPLKFNHVSGGFDCSHHKLTSLEGAPKSTGGYFDCGGNQLTNLEGAPKSVGGYFDCHGNKLTSLEFAPQSVGDGFYCYENKLTTLLGAPQSVGGIFNCNSNKILTFEGAPNHIGDYFNCYNNPIFNIWKLFKDYSKVELLNDLDPIRDKDLLMDRFNTFLSMIGLDEVESVDGYNCIN